MAEVTATLVKELRDKTDAGMMDCKKALDATAGDLEAAVDWLRKNGLSKAAKKASRVAAQGLVGVAISDGKGAIIEVNSETDFVARNEQFVQFVRNLAALSLNNAGQLDKLATASYPATGKSVTDTLTELIATIGENMNIRRTQFLSVPTGTVAAYVHNAVAPHLGTIGVLVALESNQSKDILDPLGKQIAMHIAASTPVSVNIEDVDPALIEREKDVQREQAKSSGKPADVIEKMLEGRIRKYYEEIVLLEQPFIMDPSKKVKEALQEAGFQGKISGFIRYTLGEGIEKEEKSFADEVAAMVKK